MAQDKINNLLRKVPISRRKAVKALLIGTFAAPIVTSFPLMGVSQSDQASAGFLGNLSISYGMTS